MGQSPSRAEDPKLPEDDDQPDDWDKRIFSTGCADENAKMTDCYYDRKDWRACKKEMEAFKECWKRKGNDDRTETRDTQKPHSASKA